jgi:DNA invertase Pin-like site-specific DNA recombinase
MPYAGSTATVTLRAVDYNRVSTEEQTRGYGIASGLRRNAAYIARKGWEHVGTFKDEGLSGSLGMGERADFDRLMAEAETVDGFGRRPFDVVVVPKGDRIGRKGRAFWRWVWALEDLGIFVALVDKDCDNTTAAGRAEFRRAADYAETEWETIRERTQGGLQEKAYDGGWTGGRPPFGWQIKFKGVKRESTLEVNEDEADIVRMVVGMLRTLRFSEIARRLNADGERTRSGKLWTYANLRNRILSEPILQGHVTYRNVDGYAKKDRDGNPLYGESVQIPVPSFLTDEEREFLRKIEATPTRGRVRLSAEPYPLSGRLIGLCGAQYIGRTDPEPVPLRTYICRGRTPSDPAGKRCTCRRLDAVAIERYVWSRLSESLGSSEALEDIASEWLGVAEGSKESTEIRLKEIESKIDAQSKALVTAAVDYAKAGLPAETVKAATKTLTEELEELQKMRGELVSWLEDQSAAAQRGRDLADLARMSRERLPKMGLQEQMRFIALLDLKVTILEEVETRHIGGKCSVGQWYRDRSLDVPAALTDAQWAVIEPHMPRPGVRGDIRRVTVDAILHKARTGATWDDMPARYGSKATLRTVWARWRDGGVWECIERLLTDAERSPLPGSDQRIPSVHIGGEADPRILLAGEPSPSGEFSKRALGRFAFELR